MLRGQGPVVRAVAMARDFGQHVSIPAKSDALAISQADAEGRARIVVSTIQSFRQEKPNGEACAEGLTVYPVAGSPMDRFSDLAASQADELEPLERANRSFFSLASLLRPHRQMAIVDKAHDAGTPLSFVALARFAPSLILELTAKPQTEHKPARDQHAANILHSVSATGSKMEAMIKMPIGLATDRDSRKAIGVACDCRAALERVARAGAIPETRKAGNSIRR